MKVDTDYSVVLPRTPAWLLLDDIEPVLAKLIQPQNGKKPYLRFTLQKDDHYLSKRVFLYVHIDQAVGAFTQGLTLGSTPKVKLELATDSVIRWLNSNGADVSIIGAVGLTLKDLPENADFLIRLRPKSLACPTEVLTYFRQAEFLGGQPKLFCQEIGLLTMTSITNAAVIRYQYKKESVMGLLTDQLGDVEGVTGLTHYQQNEVYQRLFKMITGQPDTVSLP